MNTIDIKVTVELGASTLAVLRSLFGNRISENKPRDVEVSETRPLTTEEYEMALGIISDEHLHNVVSKIRTEQGPKAVREVMQSFGISSSIECPQSRRKALILKLQQIGHE